MVVGNLGTCEVQKNARQVKMPYGEVPQKPILRKFRGGMEMHQQGKRDLSLLKPRAPANIGAKMDIAGGVINASSNTLALPVVVSGSMWQEEKDLEKERANQKEKEKAKAKEKPKDSGIETTKERH